jgi:DNA-binding NarL/FixJ family response regulator
MKILLVERSHVLIRDALRGVLKELAGDATVLETAGLPATMRLIENAHPDLHLILLDLNLPDRDGFEIPNRSLRKRYGTISLVVYHRPSAIRQSVVKALDLGALSFIPKSAPRDVMVNALPGLIFAGGIYIPPEAPRSPPSRRSGTPAQRLEVFAGRSSVLRAPDEYSL